MTEIEANEDEQASLRRARQQAERGEVRWLGDNESLDDVVGDHPSVGRFGTIKRAIVCGLTRLCELCHPITHRRPWLWLPINNVWCLPAQWSDQLDQRWQTGVWTTVTDEDAD